MVKLFKRFFMRKKLEEINARVSVLEGIVTKLSSQKFDLYNSEGKFINMNYKEDDLIKADKVILDIDEIMVRGKLNIKENKEEEK